MAQTLEVLQRRTETLTSIRGIVHIMKTLSVLNASPYEQAAQCVEAYHRTVLDGLAAFFHRTGGITPVQKPPETEAIVVFGSDHGLCGGYNEVVAEDLSRRLADPARTAGAPRILCVGARMNDALAGHGLRAESVLLTPASVDGIERLAAAIVGRLDQIRRRAGPEGLAVSLAYTRRGPDQQNTPTFEAFLPFAPCFLDQLARRPWTSRSLPDFSMPADALFAALVREHIFAGVFHAAAEALVTENAARLATMHRAEQSIDDRLEDLRGQTRTARQAAITSELLDVVSGFEARKARRRKKKSPAA